MCLIQNTSVMENIYVKAVTRTAFLYPLLLEEFELL